LKHERYADDWLNLVNGTKEKAMETRQAIGQKLAALGLTLSAEKTKLTHWARPVRFLGYRIKGILRPNNVGIRAVLEIPQEAYQRVAATITRTAGYIHDLIAQLRMRFSEAV
jgi:Reverse transcriptase (RNA-dependent DNA polymerase)